MRPAMVERKIESSCHPSSETWEGLGTRKRTTKPMETDSTAVRNLMSVARFRNSTALVFGEARAGSVVGSGVVVDGSSMIVVLYVSASSFYFF